MNDASHRRNETRAWVELPVEDNGEAIVAAMAEAGIEYVFFTSGSEIGFYQEAIAKAEALGRKAPKLIMVTHEHASLNAALGYSAFTGKPSVTAAHVDCGTLHYGGAIHTAWHSGLPILITAGLPPVAYPGSMRGARESEGHLWLQQTFDQNGIVRQFTKWDHHLEFQDNPGLIVSRALQVACTEPRGPVYLSLPREVTLASAKSARFPTLGQLGVARMPAPEPDGINELATKLIDASNPFILIGRSGRNPATVPALVRLAELLGIPVSQSGKRAYHCFPMTHPLYQGAADLSNADAVLALDTDIPWLIGPNQPPDDAYVAIVDVEPSKRRIPTMEFTADLRLTADSLLTIEALDGEVRSRISAADRSRFAARAADGARSRPSTGRSSPTRRSRHRPNRRSTASGSRIRSATPWATTALCSTTPSCSTRCTTICNATGRARTSTIRRAAAAGRQARPSAPSSRPPTATWSPSRATAFTCSPARSTRSGLPGNIARRI